MGRASRRKKGRQYSSAPAGVSSRGSLTQQTDHPASGKLRPDPSIAEMVGVPTPHPSNSRELPRQTNANWGGRRANQTGRPKLYASDEERRAAAAARRRATRAATKNPAPVPRGRPPKESPKNSWGGARKGAGRPLLYKTPAERRARNREISRQSFERWITIPENARLVEESRKERERHGDWHILKP